MMAAKKAAKKAEGKVGKIPLETVDIDDILPREINPNEMDAKMFAFLTQYIHGAGYLQPILVVREEDKFRIIDGEHRWRASKADGYTALDVVVVDKSLREQIIAQLNFNLIHGELNPAKYGAVLTLLMGDDLNSADLSKVIAMEQSEIDAYIALGQNINEGLYEQNKTKEKLTRKYTIVIRKDDKEFIDGAMSRVDEFFNLNDPADTLYNLCQFFLNHANRELNPPQ